MPAQYPPVTIPDTEVRRLKSSLNGDEYNILRLQTWVLVDETHLSVVLYNIRHELTLLYE